MNDEFLTTEALETLRDKIFAGLEKLGVVIDRTGERAVANSFETAALLPHVNLMEIIGAFLAEEFREGSFYAVVGIGEDPTSGTVLAQWTARRLSELTRSEVLALRGCRKDLGIGLTINGVPRTELRGKRVVVVTDVLATGATVGQLVDKLRRELHATVVGVAAIGVREDVATTIPRAVRVHTLLGIKGRDCLKLRDGDKKGQK